jgi:hypothetical protein
LGGSEIGAIANVFGIGLAIGLNAGVGLLLILPVIILTPLVWRPVGSITKETIHDEEPSGLKPLPNTSGDSPGAKQI